MKKPILEVRKIADSVYGYALCAAGVSKPICKGITQKHAKHLLKICRQMDEVPDTIIPIKDWYEFDTIVEVDNEGFGKILPER